MLCGITASFYYAKREEAYQPQEFSVFEKFNFYTTNILEGALYMSISAKLHAISIMSSNDNGNKVLIINALTLLAKGLIIDTGLTTKQLIKPKSNDFLIIPTKKATSIQYANPKDNFALTTLEASEKVTHTNITTINENFVNLDLQVTKQKMKVWIQSCKGNNSL